MSLLKRMFKGYLDERKYTDFVRVNLLAKNALEKYSDVQNVAEIIFKVNQLEKVAIQEVIPLSITLKSILS